MHSTITSKGQITLPAALRKNLQLKQGDIVNFVPLPDGNYRLEANRKIPITALRGIFAVSGPILSVEQMKDAIMEAVNEDYHRSIQP